MTSPIEKMADGAVRCVICNARFGHCACWLEIRCPKCSRAKTVERQPEDYPEAVRLDVQCPDCNSGDFDEPKYYDAAGGHIIRDPKMPANELS